MLSWQTTGQCRASRGDQYACRRWQKTQVHRWEQRCEATQPDLRTNTQAKPLGEEMGPKHLNYKENLSTKSHYTIANYNQRYKQQNCHSDSIWTCLRQHRGEREGLSRAITPIWLAGFTASFLSLCLVQSLKAIIFGAGSKDWNNLDLSQICLMLPIDFFFPFKNKWTTLTVQMALFPITGSGGFSSSHRNTQITT